MRTHRMLALSAVSAIVMAMVPTTTASAAEIGCGQRITEDLTLTTDLTCTGTGLLLDAGGLTIDLGGHTLSGSGVGIGVDGDGYAFTVKNGTIRNFERGINPGNHDLDGNRATTYVSDVTIRDTDYGVGGGGAVQVARSMFRDIRTAAVSVDKAKVTESTFIGNRWAVYANGPSVSSSTFIGNDLAILCGNSGVDVASSVFIDNRESVRANLCSVRILDSKFRGGAVAVTIGGVESSGIDVQRNAFSGAGIGLLVTGRIAPPAWRPSIVADNVFRDNGASGLVVQRAPSVLPSPGLLTVAQNRFEGNGTAPGEYADPSGNPLSSGVWVNGGTVTGNVAVRNAGHGIEAYDVLDGGSNTARANGAEPQCIGVVCMP
jgi:hypothetical protein